MLNLQYGEFLIFCEQLNSHEFTVMLVVIQPFLVLMQDTSIPLLVDYFNPWTHRHRRHISTFIVA